MLPSLQSVDFIPVQARGKEMWCSFTHPKLGELELSMCIHLLVKMGQKNISNSGIQIFKEVLNDHAWIIVGEFSMVEDLLDHSGSSVAMGNHLL